jgi:hypothetical protein
MATAAVMGGAVAAVVAITMDGVEVIAVITTVGRAVVIVAGAENERPPQSAASFPFSTRAGTRSTVRV